MKIEDYIASGILEQYCLGLTSEEESREVERMAAKHPQVRELLHELCDGIEAYAMAHSIPPPQRLKEKVMKDIDDITVPAGEAGPPVNRSGRSISMWFTAAASIAVLLLAGMAYEFYQNQEGARKDLAALSQQVRKLQDDYKLLNNSHQELQREYVLLKDIGTHHVQMVGSHHAPKAQCVVYWNPEHRDGYLNIVNLPSPPHGHQYQIWADVEGRHYNMGMVNMKAADPDSSFLHP